VKVIVVCNAGNDNLLLSGGVKSPSFPKSGRNCDVFERPFLTHNCTWPFDLLLTRPPRHCRSLVPGNCTVSQSNQDRSSFLCHIRWVEESSNS